MPLVDCPECKREISDKSECCVHCGYPIQSKNHLQQVEISKISVTAPKTMKRNTAVILTILVVLTISLWVYKDYRKFSVENEIRTSYARIVLSTAAQEQLMDITTEAWRYAIKSHENFNVALHVYFNKDSVKDVLKASNDSTAIIEKKHIFISNNAFFAGNLYKDYEVLFVKYKEIARFAAVPSSLQSYENESRALRSPTVFANGLTMQNYRNESRLLLNDFEKASDKLSAKLEKTKGATTFFEWLKKLYM